MADDKRDQSLTAHIATQLGALDSNVQNLKESFKEFKEKYDQNAVAARDHANFTQNELHHKMDKRDHPFLITIDNLSKAIKVILFLCLLAVALGIISYGPTLKRMLDAKEEIETLKPGKKR